METDHSEAAAAIEHVECSSEGLFDLTEFVIDEHAQRLKRPRSRVLARLACFDGTRHQCRELQRALDRRFSACAHDRLGNTARETLLSQCGNHFANLVDARPSEPG